MDTDRIRLLSKEIDTAKRDNKNAFADNANKWLDRWALRTKEWEFNYGFTLIETSLAALVAQEPRWIIEPLNEDGELILPVQERLLQHYSGLLDLRAEIESILQWALITGLGIAKIGYHLEDEPGVGELAQYQTSTIARPFVLTVDPRKFFVDPYCSRPDLLDARYCGDEMEVLLAQLKRPNDIYDISVTHDLKPDRIAKSYPEQRYRDRGQDSELPDDYSVKIIQEMHLRNPNLNRMEIITFAQDSPSPVRETILEEELGGEFFYVPVQLFSIPGRFYPFSILEQVNPILEMISGILKRMRNSWNSAPRKGIFYSDLTDNPQKVLATLTQGEDWEWIEAKGGGAGKVAETLAPNIITQDEIAFLNLMIDQFHRISGITYTQMGIGSSRTATESGLIQKSSDMRTNRRMSIAERLGVQIARKLLKILSYQRNNIPAREILGTHLWQQWNEYEKRQSRRERTERDTDIQVRMSVPINPAAEFRRDKMLTLLHHIGTPDIQNLLIRQDGLGDFARKVTEKIVRDSGWVEKINLEGTEQPVMEEPPAGQMPAGQVPQGMPMGAM